MVDNPRHMKTSEPLEEKPCLFHFPFWYTGIDPVIRCDPTIKGTEKKTVDAISFLVIPFAQIIEISDLTHLIQEIHGVFDCNSEIIF